MPTRRMVALLLALSLLLAACGPAAATPTPAQPVSNPTAAEVVTIGFGAQEYERQVYAPLIEAFNKENPGIQVQFVSLDEIFRGGPGDSFDPNQMMRRVVSAADTATPFFVRPEDATLGYLYDLRPLIDADPTFDRADFYGSSLDMVSHNGGIYQVPQMIQVELLSYNKDLWAARGLPTPDPGWTWSDMLAAAEQLAQTRGNTVETYGLLDFSTPFVILFAELQAAGVDLLSSRAEKIRLDTPEMETALNRVAGLTKSGAIYYDPKTSGGFDSDQMRQPILDQKAGMWRRGMLEMSGPNPSPPTFAVGTLPYPPLPLPFFSNVRGYVMSSGTQYPQEAWRWLSYLSQQEVKPPYAGPDMVSLVPARKSVAERAGYWKQLDQETAAAVHVVLDRPAPQTRVSFNFDNRIFEPVQQAINAVLNGEKRAAQAARDAQAALEQVILETATTPTPAADTSPIVVATPVAEVVPEGATVVTFSAVAADPVVVRRAADAFNRLGAGVYVKVESETFNSGPMDLAVVAARSDCFTWYTSPQAAEITATLDLQPLLDADAGTSGSPPAREDVPEALLAPFRQGSGLYGLPYAVDFRVLSYNKTAFEAAGLSAPRADWTPEEFLAAAQKLTSGSGSQKTYGFVSTGSTAEDLRFLLQRFGAELTSGSGAEVQPAFTSPKTLQIAQFVVDLLRTTSPYERLNGYTANESIDGSRSFQLISGGKAGMWFSYGLWGIGGPGQGTTVAVAPPPLGGAPLGREDVNVTGLFISAKSQHPDACWAWLNYLSTNAESLVGRFPARLSVVQSEAFGKQATPGAVEVYTAYRDALQRAPAPTPQPEAEAKDAPSIDFYWLFQALDRALQGKDLARELKTAQELTEKDLECQRGGGDPAGCATSVDPDYKGFRVPPP